MDDDITRTPQDLHSLKTIYTHDLQKEIKEFIQENVTTLWSKHVSDINDKMTQLDSQIDSVKTLEISLKQKKTTLEEEFTQKNEKLHQRIHWVSTKMNKYEDKFNRKFDQDLLTVIDASSRCI